MYSLQKGRSYAYVLSHCKLVPAVTDGYVHRVAYIVNGWADWWVLGLSERRDEILNEVSEGKSGFSERVRQSGRGKS